MKIRSYNIRGLGSCVKKQEIFNFFTKNDLNLCCVQETKIEGFSKMEGRLVWKKMGVGWCCEDSVGRSGGILTFWDQSKFVSSS